MRKSRELESLLEVSSIFSIYGIDCKLSDSEYDYYDLVMTTGSYKGVLIEVKQRYFDKRTFIKYCKEGFMFESKKYNNLRKQRSLYVNYFEIEDIKVCLIWQVSKIKGNIMDFKAPKTTDFRNNTMITKEVILVNYEQSNGAYINKGDGWFKFTGSLEELEKVL